MTTLPRYVYGTMGSALEAASAALSGARYPVKSITVGPSDARDVVRLRVEWADNCPSTEIGVSAEWAFTTEPATVAARIAEGLLLARGAGKEERWTQLRLPGM